MTYYVSSGTLNPTDSLIHSTSPIFNALLYPAKQNVRNSTASPHENGQMQMTVAYVVFKFARFKAGRL